MMASDILSAVLHAYQLTPPDAVARIYNGTNKVYRLDWAKTPIERHIAVKISPQRQQQSPASKQREHYLVTQLGSRLAIIPRMLTPLVSTSDARCFSWGILYQHGTLVSCYDWMQVKPYRGITQQLISAGRSVAVLHKSLEELNKSPPGSNDTSNPQQRFRYDNNQLVLDKHFNFTTFQKLVDSLPATHAAGELLQANLDFLQHECDELHAVITQYSKIYFDPLQWIHMELSPANFGFDGNNDVACIFDFESFGLGLLLQDIGWHVATFCIDYRYNERYVIEKLMILLPILNASILLGTQWRVYLLSFMRMGYLDAILKKLTLYAAGADTRLGFAKEDLLCLRWLRQHNTILNQCIRSI